MNASTYKLRVSPVGNVSFPGVNPTPADIFHAVKASIVAKCVVLR
jgi:hypothetical protein